MITKLWIKEDKTAKAVWGLQQRSYKVEAEYIGTMDFPPLQESIEDLFVCGEIFMGYMDHGVLAGVISYKLTKGVVDIHRLVVEPAYFRRGIARRLIQHVMSVYRNESLMVVSTGAKNEPAIKLYESLGFEKIDDRLVEGRILITTFKKVLYGN